MNGHFQDHLLQHLRSHLHHHCIHPVESRLLSSGYPLIRVPPPPPPTDALNRVPTYTGNKLPSGRAKSGPYISGNKLPQSYPSSDLSAESVETQFSASFRDGKAKLSQLKNKKPWVIGLSSPRASFAGLGPDHTNAPLPTLDHSSSWRDGYRSR